MRLRPGLRPGPCWGAYSAPPDPLAGYKVGLVGGCKAGCGSCFYGRARVAIIVVATTVVNCTYGAGCCRYEQSFQDMLKFQNVDPSSTQTLRK